MVKESFKNIFLYFILSFLFTINIKSFAQKDIVYKSSIKNSSLKKKKIIPLYDGIDGPYIINDTLFKVDVKNRLVIIPKFNKDSIIVNVDNKDKSKFYFSLKSDYTVPKSNYVLPKKMAIISDIEGNFTAFAGFLFANGIIDKNHDWVYGDGHLVLGGDFVDRGENVTQVLWLIYKLEQQAKLQNGVVHFILGNHEILNFNGDFRYNQDKYIKVAQEISQYKNKKEAVKYIYSENSELGKWLARKNVIEKIGPYLFVHAGLSPKILEYKLSLNDINNLARSKFRSQGYKKDKVLNFLFGSKGPLWYRGLVKDNKYYDKISPLKLELVLNYFESEKIVVGHTFVKNISTDFKGKIIRTDVHHGDKRFSAKTQGLLIENGREFVIDADYRKTPIKSGL